MWNKKIAANICELPPLDGDGRMACMAFFKKWYYNSKTGKCEEFVYGGCGGNENKFETKDECERACVKK